MFNDPEQPTNRTMNTPTPRTDEAWAAWPYAGSGMSVHVGRELERELTAAREEIENLKFICKCESESSIEAHDILKAVTEQRDGLRSGIDYASDQLTRVTEQRDKALQKIKNQAERIAYLEGATNHATGTPLSKAIEQRDRLAAGLEVAQQVGIQLGEQRDRLAEALRQIASSDPNWRDCLLIAREALAAVKGENHES